MLARLYNPRRARQEEEDAMKRGLSIWEERERTRAEILAAAMPAWLRVDLQMG